MATLKMVEADLEQFRNDLATFQKNDTAPASRHRASPVVSTTTAKSSMTRWYAVGREEAECDYDGSHDYDEAVEKAKRLSKEIGTAYLIPTYDECDDVDEPVEVYEDGEQA